MKILIILLTLHVYSFFVSCLQHFNTPNHQRHFDDPQRLHGARQMLTKMEDNDFRTRAWQILIAEEQAKNQAKLLVNDGMNLVLPPTAAAASNISPSAALSPRWQIASGWQEIDSHMILDAAWTEVISNQASNACSSIHGHPYAVTLIQGIAGDLHAWKYHSTQYYNSEEQLKEAMAAYSQDSAMRWWPRLLDGNSQQQLDRGTKLKQLRRLRLTMADALGFFSEWLQTIYPATATTVHHFPYSSAAWDAILAETNESDQLSKWHQLPTWLCVRQRI